MLRRYAMALEEVVGKKIDLHPRDGRQYTGEQVAVLIRAKEQVTDRRGLGVETAIRLALGEDVPDAALLPPAVGVPRGSDLEAVRTVLEPFLTEMRALRRGDERALEVLEGIRSELVEARADREELRELRAEVEALRSEVGEPRRLPAASTVSRDDEPAAVEVEGPFVRAARWLERRLRGREG